jgi:RNA polymerase sigma factor (TIGR02999 family)
MSKITPLLTAIEAGDPNAASELWALVYDELRQLAAAWLAAERADHTLDPTALVHEAWMRLAGQTEDGHFANSRHFFAAAAEAMRRILVESARRKGRQKRAGNHTRIDLNELAAASLDRDDNMLDLDDALGRLAAVDPQAAELVKLRYFAGLTVSQSAELLHISPRSADFLWAYSRAFLLRALGGHD